MSRINIKQPIVHTPGFREYKISGSELYRKYQAMGVIVPFPMSDNWYYHSDREGWAGLVSHLLFKSNLYKTDRFDCEDYAIKSISQFRLHQVVEESASFKTRFVR